MKIKIICILICTLFLVSIFSVIVTAKNLTSINTSVVNSNVDLRRDLIKITDEYPVCDIDKNYVIYPEDANPSTYLYIYNITTGETDQVYLGGDIIFPKISENKVVYYDLTYFGFKMYNINTGEKTDLIVTNWEGGDTDSFSYFGDYIVYENFYPDLYSTEIFLYNITSDENIQLTYNPGDDYSENPCIYKDIVAWQFNEGNIADIFMYNIDNEEYTRVTNTSQFESETFPSVYDNSIVYSYFYYDKVNGTILYGLKIYNIETGEETTIFTQEEPTGSTPEIFNNIIAYSEPGVCLRLLDLITNINTTIYEGDMLSYPWNLNGNYIAFTVVRDGIYIYRYNNSPEPPEINGPTRGKPGTSYNYIFKAVDPDGNQVKYLIDWGDGKTDATALNPSGVDVIVSHTWSKKGDYTIKVYAQDEYGLNSLDSTFPVKMPRTIVSHGSLFLRFLERFPLLERLLKSGLITYFKNFCLI